MKMRILRAIALVLLLAWPGLAAAEADSIMGVDSATGVSELLTPGEAGDLIGIAQSGLDANFDISGGNSITGANESKPLNVLDGGATNGVRMYWHSSGKLVIKCVVASIEGDCNVAVELGSSKVWKVTDSTGSTVYFQIDQSTGKVSRMTVDGEDTNVAITLYTRICGGNLAGVDPVSGTAGHIWDKSPLDTAPTAVAITGTNQTYGVIRFPDSDGDHGIQMSCLLPLNQTGAIDVRVWGKTAGTGNFRIQLATKCYATDEAADAAFNTPLAFTLAAGTANRLISYYVPNITITGCTAGEMLFLRVFRNRTEGSDTLNNTFDMKELTVWARNVY